MPEKDGAEEKSTKSVVNKKQKQMMGEEGYDIARDMGKVRPSKDKKDATTMPPSKEMKKTRKVVKGPSAFERVKKKYKGQIMNVGKKKVKEELDLTKVAEAFGGYIVEAEVTSNVRGNVTSDADRKTRNTSRKRGRVLSSREKENLERARQDRYGSTGRDINKKYGIPPVGSTGSQYTVQPGEEEATKELMRKFATTGTGAGTNIPDFPKNITGKQFKDFMDRQMGRTKDIETNTREQSKKAGEKLKNQQDKVTSGDERQTDRPTVTYSTFTRKPKVTGGEDRATDTRSSVYIPKPETKPETKKRVRRVKPKKDKVITQQEPQKTKTEPQTQTQMGDGEPPKPPNVTTSTGASGDTPQAFSSIKKFAKSNPQIAAAGALAGYDLGKGILSKIMNLRGPGLRGGTVGRRTAGSNIAT